MILLASLPPSYENFVSSLNVDKDSITYKKYGGNVLKVNDAPCKSSV